MLTLHFVPYEEISGLTGPARVQKILGFVKENKIVIVDGKLRKEEEVQLIKTTMEEVDEDFKGIELQVWDSSQKNKSLFDRMRMAIASMLVPELNEGFTIIGPANIIKEIKKDPGKIQLITQGTEKVSRRRRR